MHKYSGLALDEHTLGFCATTPTPVHRMAIYQLKSKAEHSYEKHSTIIISVTDIVIAPNLVIKWLNEKYDDLTVFSCLRPSEYGS